MCDAPDCRHDAPKHYRGRNWRGRFRRTPGRLFGLGSAVRAFADRGEPPEAAGEVGWGGLAGTLWWIHPRLNVAAVLLTQRYFGYAHPYGLRFKRKAYQALMAR